MGFSSECSWMATIKIYDRDLNLDMYWKDLWEEFSYTVSWQKLYRMNSMFTTKLYCYNSPSFSFLSCSVKRASYLFLLSHVHLAGQVCMYCIAVIYCSLINPFW